MSQPLSTPDSEADGHTMRRRTLITTLVAVSILFTGCLGGESPDPSDEVVANTVQQPVFGLLTADNTTAYANENGLELNDGAVKVVVEIDTDADGDTDSIDDYFTQSQSSPAGQAIGYVTIDSIPELAAEEQVTLIRRPAPAIEERTPMEGSQ